MRSKNIKPSTLAIIASAGSGFRFGGKKQFAGLRGKPVLAHSASAIFSHPWVTYGIILVPQEDLMRTTTEVVQPYLREFDFPINVVAGGVLRQDSVAIGLSYLAESSAELVVIHDGVRPLVEGEAVDRCLRAARECGAATVATLATDTIKQSDAGDKVNATLDRRNIWLTQTPQAFRAGVIVEAHKRVQEEGIEVTDDCSLVERYGLAQVALVEGGKYNLKITEPRDLVMAEALLGK
jgi:2-C-methyl-D-erythritol 4-phosphate cytidylyltransferase